MSNKNSVSKPAKTDPKGQSADTSALTSVVTFRMAKAQTALNAQASRILRANSDISLVEWRVLLLLSHFKEASMSMMAAEVQMDKGQLSRKITKMVKRGLISSTPDPLDQRKQKLQLTAKSDAIRQQMQPIMDDRQNRLKAEISDDELAVFYSVLDRIETAAHDT